MFFPLLTVVEIGALNAAEELGWVNKTWKELSKPAQRSFNQLVTLVDYASGVVRMSCFFGQQILRQNYSPQEHLCYERSSSLREGTGQDSRDVVETAIKIINCLLVFFLQGYVYFWASSQHAWSSLSSAAFSRCLDSSCLIGIKDTPLGSAAQPHPCKVCCSS